MVCSLTGMKSGITKIIRENERFLSHVLQIAGLGAYVMDIARGVFVSSGILDEIFGFSPKGLHTYDEWVALLHPEDRQMVTEYFTREVVGQHQRFDKKYRIIRVSDGEARWVHGYGDLEYDSENRPVVMIGTIQDITERNRAEQALQQSETRYRELIALAVDGIMLGSHEGIILEANQRMCEMTGLTRADLVGRHIRDALFTPDSLANEPLRFDLLHKGETVVRERQILRANGEMLFVELRTRMMPDGTYQSIYRDITERKTAETLLYNFAETLARRVEERTRELEAANASLDKSVIQLRTLAMELTRAEEGERKRVAGILHDQVQQSIAAATMKISLLGGRMPAAERTRVMNDTLAILGEALDASRSLTVSLCPPVLLEAGLRPGLKWLAEWMKEKHGLTVRIVGDESLSVPGPLNILLFQAVRELLFNVVKHAGVKMAWVSLERPQASLLSLTVSDHGKGFTGQDATTPGLSGGLGLFHLRERLIYCGGSLTVTGGKGRGTRVVIVVPVDA